ncbi:PAS domain-containing protein [Fibrella sp. WM1]|uniref:PAS domain-containing protein n=1 Tax=Fibrella musci TaxID=3242485 RepID=UPI003523057B
MKDSSSLSHPVPLLCWDIANPLLAKRQHMATDLQAFEGLKKQHDWQFNTNLHPLLTNNATLVVTDRSARIIWVSHRFSQLTGYPFAEVLGQKASLLQGAKTSLSTRQLVREKLARAEAVTACLLNYRKNRSTYWCQIDIQPLLNATGQCTHFFAIEYEISSPASS